MAKFKDYYAVLGVSPRSHARVIEEKYWERAHELHHVLHIEPTKKLQKKLTQINEAYEVLGSPHKRSAYDRKLSDVIEHQAGMHRPPTFLQSFVTVLSKPFRPD
ncbi:MAG: DnaJ domain-containing protein [Chloroflexi bacterium]|nr:DnaJ domain-containing protein [Chloroflexota bacterium]